MAVQHNKRTYLFPAVSEDSRAFLFLLLPTIVVLFAVTIYPTIYGLWLSLHKLPVGSFQRLEFAGFQNYRGLFRSREFWDSLRVTLVFVVCSTAGSFLVGTVLALLTNRDFPGKALYTSLLILPTVATPVVSGLMWKYMLNVDSGIINYILRLVGLPPLMWLASSSTALVSVIIVEAWQWSPFTALLMLAGLQSVPQDLCDAARVDGANRIQTMLYVILPQLAPVIITILLLRAIDSFKSFDTIFVMTAGGPGRATQIFNILAYYTGFRFFEFGRAAALTIVGLVTLILLSQVLTRRWGMRQQ